MTWETVPLGEVVSPVSGRAGARELPVYSVTKHSGFVPSADYFKKQVFSQDLSSYKVVEKGQFAYATIHLDEGSIGIAPEACIISPMYTVFSVDQSRVDAGYLIRLMKSPAAVAQYSRLGRGTAERRKSIPLEALGRLGVPLPPLPEQRRIAAILDEADALRALSAVQENRQGELLDSFFDSAARVSGRRSVTVGDLVESSQYGTSAKAGDSGQFPILRMGNITNDGRIDLTNMKFIDIDESDRARYLVHRGDLLFNRTNSADLVGKTAVYREAEPRAFAGYLVRLRPKSLELGEYVAGYLNSRHGKLTLRKMAKSIVGMANINAREALSIRLPEPDPTTLNQLLDLRQRVEVERKRLDTRRRWTDQLFASLQYRAFQGEL